MRKEIHSTVSGRFRQGLGITTTRLIYPLLIVVFGLIMKGKLTYTGIRVNNMDESIGFYTKILGMKLMERNKFDLTNGEIASLVSEDRGHELELNYYDKSSKHYSEYTSGEQLDHLAFKVENLDQALEEAKKAGYPPVLEMKGETSKWAYIQDPNGIYIELIV